MSWWRRHRRNLLGLVALLALVPLAGWVTLGDASAARARRPHVPVVAPPDSGVSYGGTILRLNGVTPVESLPSFEGEWSPPAGYRLWSATVAVELKDPSSPPSICSVALEGRDGIVVDGDSRELSQATGASAFTSCVPDGVPSGEPPPPSYELDIPFLTAEDFEPAAVRFIIDAELPRYASFPVPPADTAG